MSALAATAMLGACGGAGPDAPVRFGPPNASFLTDDLVQVTLPVEGRPTPEALRKATDCAVAEAVLLKGAAFARHVRTIRTEEGGIAGADAVYTVSGTLPGGPGVIDAASMADTCRDTELRGV